MCLSRHRTPDRCSDSSSGASPCATSPMRREATSRSFAASSMRRESWACTSHPRRSRPRSCRPPTEMRKSIRHSSASMTRCARHVRRVALAGLVVAIAGCGGRSRNPAKEPPAVARDTIPPRVAPESLPPEKIEDVNAPQEPGLVDNSQVVRIALAAGVPRVTVSATGEWKLYDSNGESTLLHGDGGEQWSIESERGGLRASRSDGSPTGVRPPPFIVRSVVRGSFVMVNGKRYRGEIAVLPAPGGVTVINRLYMEDYLRGVVPLEIGQHRTDDERAAVEAQAVAARSYAYTHLVRERERPYDMLATVLDQVYGGADAEVPLADRAVLGTTRVVLTYNGRIINAPYQSTCGGSTTVVC